MSQNLHPFFLNSPKREEPALVSSDYQDFSDLLGGSGAEKPDDSDLFLFSDDRRGKFPLEVFWLKWRLFESLCKEVLTYHKTKRQPHLGLDPEKIKVEHPADGSGASPRYWSFKVRIPENEGAWSEDPPGIPDDLAGRMYRPAGETDPLYSSPIIRHENERGEIPATPLIRSMERIKGEEKVEAIRGLVEVQLISDQISVLNASENDIFGLILRFTEGATPPVLIWSSKFSSNEKGLLIKGMTAPIPLSSWKKLEEKRQAVFNQSGVMVYKATHVPLDIYSLGRILLRTLLVNDRDDMAMAAEKANRISGRLESIFYGIPEDDFRSLSRRLRELLKEEGSLFPKESFLFRGKDRDHGAPSIPDEIWNDALIIAFKMITWIPGFSFCQNHGDYTPGSAYLSLERAMVSISRISQWLKLELFHSDRRNQEMTRVFERARFGNL